MGSRVEGFHFKKFVVFGDGSAQGAQLPDGRHAVLFPADGAEEVFFASVKFVATRRRPDTVLRSELRTQNRV
jgi:hypothetical protein